MVCSSGYYVWFVVHRSMYGLQFRLLCVICGSWTYVWFAVQAVLCDFRYTHLPIKYRHPLVNEGIMAISAFPPSNFSSRARQRIPNE